MWEITGVDYYFWYGYLKFGVDEKEGIFMPATKFC